MPLRIRSEQPADIAPIAALTAAAFLDAPHSSHTEHFIVDALRRAGQLSLSLVAESEGAIVGHIAISPVSISDGGDGWYGLGPLSVAPERQGRGIGSRLVEQALAALRRRGAAGCVVLGEPEYYGRFGFRAEPALWLPGVPPQYFQAIAFREPMPTGNVSYQKAFDARG
ncbi:GNAT family N-acetyltransferase [Azotobacter chroococcum]|uniref:GNAT family N-acetyltransferase n=1 Tax=Azotobacter chroococcum TaxID=353 RepID=UPI0010AE18A3|nr:N-acetyltransferase [Azotobacter chroococcum]TKD29861.1 N-acetyltransferase [Azotobacter chroococcum]